MGADSWIVSKSPPADPFGNIDEVVSGTVMTDVIGETCVGAGVTCPVTGSSVDIAVVWTEMCVWDGMPVLEGTEPDGVCDTVRDV
jgi:hypothetical protein